MWSAKNSADTQNGARPRLKRAFSSFSSETKAQEFSLPPTRWQIFRQDVRKRWRRLCKVVCSSRIFATVSTLLTVYALFGDDMRLMLSSKQEDQYFDIVTTIAMVTFVTEIIAFIGGKPEYLWGFFFWLDIISTVTLLLDITAVGEHLFGDRISSIGAGSGGGESSAGDSAEAARAARMSRAGTKAGRVVRLIRLLRLIKMMKVFKKDDKKQSQSYPGEDWDDDEDSNVQESAVSKKLSEMTTRRVIVLVLTIMLSLPLFRPEMYNDVLDTAGQYGMNMLYRRWRDGISKYDPLAGAANETNYMASVDRQVYEDAFLLYVYRHNWFLESSDVPGDKSSPEESFNRLFWLGVTPASSSLAPYVLPRLTSYDWNVKWNGAGWGFFSGDMPNEIQNNLRAPWNTSRLCVKDIYRGRSLISLEDDGIVCPEELRFQERTIVSPQLLTEAEATQINFMFVFDRRDGSKYEAMLNTFQTLFVCLLLGVGSMTFASDANKLVLAPIERMISKLDRIRNNPLEALKIGDEDAAKANSKAAKPSSDEDDEDETSRSRLKKALAVICPCCRKRLGGAATQVPEPMETQVLERTIIKIGSLLALGFGEAGSQIIGQNMKDGDSSAVMGVAGGHKVEGVFAYCDIKHFIDVTEVLQDQVMIFVNRIAAIVHAFCDEFWGNPNKNVGDAFLLVWRLSGQCEKSQVKLTDMALLALVSMIGKLATSEEIAEYRIHPKLLKRIPDYRTRVGFGLHLGWAIEGAIGSDYKIDASYLSPNVKMASLLEHETRYYGAHILFSEAVNNLLSPPIQEECRLIDCVDLSGGDPVKIYTLDLDDEALDDFDGCLTRRPSIKASKFKSRLDRQRRKNERWADDFDLHKLFDFEEPIVKMRCIYTEEFLCKYKMAFLNYEAGNWPIAKVMLEETRHLLAIEDGASAALLRWLQMHDNVAPKRWKGYRGFGQRAKRDQVLLHSPAAGEPVYAAAWSPESTTPVEPGSPLLPPGHASEKATSLQDAARELSQQIARASLTAPTNCDVIDVVSNFSE